MKISNGELILYMSALGVAAYKTFKHADQATGRLLAGVAAGGFTAIYGPGIYDKAKQFATKEASSGNMKNLLYTAGGAIGGGLLMNKAGPKLEESILRALTETTEKPEKPAEKQE